MKDMIIKVNTDVLVSASDNLTTKVQKAKNTFEQIEAIINRTNSYWEGDGHTYMANAYSTRSDDFNRIFNEINNHVINLKTIAGVYQVTEKNAEILSNSLPGDVLE